MYFMSTACGRPQGVERGPAHVDGGGGQKPDFFVDVINGWPLGQNLCSISRNVLWVHLQHEITQEVEQIERDIRFSLLF